MVDSFITSRRQGISKNTLLFYHRCLDKAIGIDLTASGINWYLSSLNCGNAKHAYYRAIRALCNWLFRNDYLLDNPLKKVDPPKPVKRILPSLTVEQLYHLLEQASNPRDKAIISLFADSGMRLNELTTVKASDIDWDNHTVTIWGKGSR